ncbi:hypothetical protein EPZ47_24370 [Pseudomonas viciae]|uniref:Uncharacterized protein n=1 Tax=Pseudomonas viciae TaxID=2505979 RepID=A0A4P7PLA8_9PSED|nr:hypothetical protein EPZ47_24370 [Pseudomonas viciae]
MGAGLLAKAVYQSTSLLDDRPNSRASPLPQGSLPGRGYGISFLFHLFPTKGHTPWSSPHRGGKS